MRIIGLDVGTKTVGVAISDELELIAQGYGVIERVGLRKDTGKILDLIREHDCGQVVVGLPLRLDGGDSPMTELAREFAAMLMNKLKSNRMSHVTVEFYDERFTTAMAEKVLLEADLSRAKRKQLIDQQAAVVILQNYLDLRSRRKSLRE
ncbi:MAG TPA: Holliday junction resolvase RuvX [Clostridiales bacterium]|nr:Holliday junction resolvase RuvX [Clostridiales bacterium]